MKYCVRTKYMYNCTANASQGKREEGEPTKVRWFYFVLRPKKVEEVAATCTGSG